MATVRLERRLAAILAADVVGYSRLVELDEAGTFARLKALRRELVEPVLERHRGRFVDLKGDGAIVEFRSAVEAVEAAVEIQRAIPSREAGVPEDRRLRYRIGINLGDLIVDNDGICGDGICGGGINVAARIEGLCEPGGVWLSRSVHNQVKGKIDLSFVPCGRHQVKNIVEPVETFRVALDGVEEAPPPAASGPKASPRRWPLAVAGAALAAALVLGAGASYLRPAAAPGGGRPGIAVLPFANLGGDSATGRLADGITEDIITDLARFRDLDVIARNSTEAYAAKPVDVREIGRDLGVGYVLEGSIQQQGGRARVTVQLVSAGSGAHLWSERWDRPAADVFAVQAEVAEQVATTLAGYGVIADVGRAAAKRRLPEDLTAYDLYLLGAEAKHRATRESTDDAIRLFARAVEVDPNLARAWVGLAWARAQAEGFGADPAVARQGQAEAGRRALELDPTDAEAHAVMAEVHGARGEFALGAAEYARAFGLNPSSAQILMLYTGWASSFGQAEEGARAANRAARINPNYPVWAASRFIYAYLMAGRPEDALRVAERIPAESLRTRDLVMIAASHAALGRPGRAAAVARDALKRFPGFSVEGYVVNNPRWSETERALLVDTMRMAGFPACATAETVTRLTEPKRLPECAVTAAAG